MSNQSDDPLRRVAALSVHTSPVATLGGPDAGGLTVYVRYLACHLAQLGVQTDIFTRRTDPLTPETQELCPGVNVVTITAGPLAPVHKNQLFAHLPTFAAETALYSLRAGVRYDIMHSHYWLSGWVAHLLKRYWETPFVHMFHTTAHMKNAVADNGPRETDLRIETERRLVRLADGLIAANPDERADLIWRQHAPTDKVCTVPPGVDLKLFQPVPAAASREQFGVPLTMPTILFVGRIDPIKGITTLLEAFAILSASAGSSRPLLLIAGGELDHNGEPVGDLAAVRDQARRLAVDGRVRFLGSVPQTDLPALYSAADVVAVPSRYESFGLTAVEAMACGTPVVASRVGGLRFTVEEEVSGLLVPPNQPNRLAAALGRVLDDRDLRTAFSAGAIEAAQRFAWPLVATSILHVYQRLAEGHRANLCDDEEVYA